MRKPALGVCDQVRLKPVCSATEVSYSLETLDSASIGIIWTASSEFGTYRAVSPEPSLLAHRSSESRGTFRQKARSLAPLNGWACAVKTCHDGMLEDTNSLDAAHII